ncbi:MAG: thrombospondin type 3 repeat-containing protein [Deltaproteobacteria bacterium]|nr:thrombospondin type 3 repeat-containing protein [Deltaproteobacteria bacterium]
MSIADSNTAMGGFTIHQVACVDPGVAGQIVSGCARTEYRLDGGPLQPFVPPISITTPGIHTLDFGSVDVAGNDEVVKTEILTVVAPSDLDGDGLLGFGDNCDRAANPDQRDTDRDCIGNRCDADFNQNGVVDSSDASLLKARLGQSAASFPDQDLDGDGTVGVGDTTILRALFRQPPGPSWGLPYDVVIQWCE